MSRYQDIRNSLHWFCFHEFSLLFYNLYLLDYLVDLVIQNVYLVDTETLREMTVLIKTRIEGVLAKLANLKGSTAGLKFYVFN